MGDDLIDRLRPLGLEQHASRLTRIVSDAMQIIVNQGPLRQGYAGDVWIDDMDGAASRLSGEGDFVLDLARKLGEPGLEAMVAQAKVSDQAALQAFRDRARRDGGILPLLEIHLDGFETKLDTTRTGLKSEFGKHKIDPLLKSGPKLATGPKLPTGPMTIMSDSMGCLGAELAIGGGAGLMVVGMVMEDGGMFTFGAVALGIGIAAAGAFC